MELCKQQCRETLAAGCLVPTHAVARGFCLSDVREALVSLRSNTSPGEKRDGRARTHRALVQPLRQRAGALCAQDFVFF